MYGLLGVWVKRMTTVPMSRSLERDVHRIASEDNLRLEAIWKLHSISIPRREYSADTQPDGSRIVPAPLGSL